MALDLFNCKSPLISIFIPTLIESLQVLIPPTPAYKDPTYISKLLIMGSILKNYQVERLRLVYSHEQRMYTSKIAKETASHFPEFFGTELPKPETNIVKIKIPTVDPGALKEDPTVHLQLLRLFAHRYTALAGFPFWEILPVWYRLSGIWAGSTNDIITPTTEKQPDNIIHFSNPSEIEMRIKLTPRCALPIETMIAVSNSSFFDDPKYISGIKHKQTN